MTEWGVFGVIVTVVGFIVTVFGISSRINAPMKENNKITAELVKQITVLNVNFEHMKERDTLQDERLNRHRTDINLNKAEISNHEFRIKAIEETKFIKDRVN